MFLNKLNKLGRLNKNILKNVCFVQKPIKLFSTINNEENLRLEVNPNEESELLINVPKNLALNYTMGQLNFFILYENFTTLNKLTSFIPAHKTNILVFTYLTYISYASQMFQPSLCLLFYMINKLFLTNSRQLCEVISLTILPNMKTILVRTILTTYKLELVDSTLEQNYNVGGEVYHVLKNPTAKHSLYIKDNARFVHKDLVLMLLSGNYSQARFVYL